MKRSGRERQTSKKNWPVSYVENYVSRQDNTLPVTGHGRGANMNPFLPQWATPLGVPLLAWLRFSQDCAPSRVSSRRISSLTLFPVAPNISWLVDTSVQPSRPSSANLSLVGLHSTFSSVCLDRISLLISLKKILVMAFRTHPDNPI